MRLISLDVASLSFETAGNTWDAGNLQISGLLDVNGVGINDIAGTLNLSGSTLTSSSTLLINPTNNFDINIGDSDLFIDNSQVMLVLVIRFSSYKFNVEGGDIYGSANLVLGGDLTLGGNELKSRSKALLLL